MFITQFAKAGVIEEGNKQVLSEIALMEQHCVEFDLACAPMGDKWGIRLNLGVGSLAVHPLELVSSIYNDDWYFMDMLSGNQGHRCEVTIRKQPYCYEWTILCTSLSLHLILHFKFADYVDKITQAVRQLRQIKQQGLPCADCTDKVDIATLEMCEEQLSIVALYPSHCKLMTDRVKTEEFIFYVVGDHVEHFQIGIGNRSYATWFTQWSNNLETIRHQLESLLLIYDKESEIDLDFDTSATTLRVKFVSVLDKIEEVGSGLGFKYKEFVRVAILPNDCVEKPVLAGYCDRKQFVKALYEGLLALALQYPIHNNEDENRMEAYAKLKSPEIERFIRSEKTDYCRAHSRDARVKQIVEMSPDYASWGYSLSEDCPPFTVEADGTVSGLYDVNGKTICLPELYAWQHEIEPIIVASETGEPYEKDWADYHRRGLEIANKLRRMLSPDFDLWYDAPVEDMSGTISRSLLVL